MIYIYRYIYIYKYIYIYPPLDAHPTGDHAAEENPREKSSAFSLMAGSKPISNHDESIHKIVYGSLNTKSDRYNPPPPHTHTQTKTTDLIIHVPKVQISFTPNATEMYCLSLRISMDSRL